MKPNWRRVRSRRALDAARGEPHPEELRLVLERDRRDMENIRRLIAFGLEPTARCVDVGAHRGAVLHEMCRAAPEGRHLAYEPLPHLAHALRQQFPQVSVRQAALSNRSGEAEFMHVMGDAEGCSGFEICTLPKGFPAELEAIRVAVERLDDTEVAELPIALVKVDVEGAEQQVFDGARETLSRTLPTIVFEHSYAASSAYGSTPVQLYDLLTHDIGMRIFDLDGNGPMSALEFETYSCAGHPINFVAHC